MYSIARFPPGNPFCPERRSLFGFLVSSAFLLLISFERFYRAILVSSPSSIYGVSLDSPFAHFRPFSALSLFCRNCLPLAPSQDRLRHPEKNASVYGPPTSLPLPLLRRRTFPADFFPLFGHARPLVFAGHIHFPFTRFRTASFGVSRRPPSVRAQKRIAFLRFYMTHSSCRTLGVCSYFHCVAPPL